MAHILLVDDQDDVRELLCRVLESAGHTCTQAADGADALEWLEDHTPDLVITDIFMPNMDGFDLARALNSKPVHPIVIGMSGDPREITHDLAKNLGATSWLTKPFAPKTLLAVVNEALSKKS